MDTRQSGDATGRRLGTTLALAFVALSIVTLLLTASIELYFSIRAQQNAVFSYQQLTAHNAAASVSTFIGERLNALDTTVRVNDPNTSSSESWTRSLQGLLALHPSLRHLVVLDSDDRVVARASRDSRVALDAFVASLTRAQLDKMRGEAHYVSPAFIDPASNEPQVLLAVPVVNALGDRYGMLVANMNLKFMWELMDSLDVGEGGYAYVVDREGKLLAFQDTGRVLRGENVSQIEAVRLFTATPAETVIDGSNSYDGLTGEHVVGAAVPLGMPDWAVVVETPEYEAYRSTINRVLVQVGVLVAMAILAGALGVYLARRLTAPLEALTGSATRVAAGERDQQVAVSGPLEVANLAAAFNSMTAQLHGSLGELEERVARRTADLQSALEEVETRAREQERLLDENAQQRQAIRELSVPLLPVTGQTLVLPLIGALDSQRLADVQDRALHAIERSGTRSLLLDITGVPVVDTQVAQGLLQLAAMSRLLGAEVTLIGIRPEVAQTIVGLGLTLNELPTAADLQTALQKVRLS